MYFIDQIAIWEREGEYGNIQHQHGGDTQVKNTRSDVAAVSRRRLRVRAAPGACAGACARDDVDGDNNGDDRRKRPRDEPAPKKRKNRC